MFDQFERTVHRTLRKLAKQRVRMVLLPGNYWVVERAIDQDDDTRAALLTCQMRGWVEPLLHAVPTALVTPRRRAAAELQFGEGGAVLSSHLSRLVRHPPV
jgi:hypothetical protein